MINDGMFSSAKDDWETPQDFFDRYNSEYHFTLDAASDDKNAECKNHFTKETDGLHNSWGGANGVAEPTVWESNRRMGAESIRRKQKTGHNGCLPVACENGHKMVPRLLQVWEDRVHSRTAEVWEKQKLCSISVNGCCV